MVVIRVVESSGDLSKSEVSVIVEVDEAVSREDAQAEVNSEAVNSVDERSAELAKDTGAGTAVARVAAVEGSERVYATEVEVL